MPRPSSALITLGTSGAVSYQRLAHDDMFAILRDNEPEATQLLAEGRFDYAMLTGEKHPLLRTTETSDIDWLAGPRPKRRKKKRTK